jgi:hypothetical protein
MAKMYCLPCCSLAALYCCSGAGATPAALLLLLPVSAACTHACLRQGSKCYGREVALIEVGGLSQAAGMEEVVTAEEVEGGELDDVVQQLAKQIVKVRLGQQQFGSSVSLLIMWQQQ